MANANSKFLVSPNFEEDYVPVGYTWDVDAFASIDDATANATSSNTIFAYGGVHGTENTTINNYDATSLTFSDKKYPVDTEDPTIGTTVTAKRFYNSKAIDTDGDVTFRVKEMTNTGTVTLNGDIFTGFAGNAAKVTNTNGTFSITSSNVVAEFTGGVVNLAGGFAETEITGTATINTTNTVTLNGADDIIPGGYANVTASTLNLSKTITLKGNAELTATTVNRSGSPYVLVQGNNKLYLPTLSTTAIFVAVNAEGATLHDSTVGGTVSFGKNVHLLGTNVIDGINIQGTDKETTNYKKLTIGDGDNVDPFIPTSLTAKLVRVGQGNTDPDKATVGYLTINNAEVTITNNTGTEQAPVLNGQFLIAKGSEVDIVNSTVAADIVHMPGSLTVDYNSTITVADKIYGYTTGTITVDVDNDMDKKLYTVVKGNLDKVSVVLDGELKEGYTLTTINNQGVFLTTETTKTLYVNAAWAGLEVGELTDNTPDAHLYGYNAFSTLADAAKAAKGGTTISVGGEGTLAAESAFVCGGNVTIEGEATFDWGKDWMFVGRGEQGDTVLNTTVIFKDATITRADNNNCDRSIHISGAEKDAEYKKDGTVILDHSSVETEYIINKNQLTVKTGSTLTVNTYLNVSARPKSETPYENVPTAHLDVDSATVSVSGNVEIGNEGKGEVNLTNGADFNVDGTVTNDVAGTINIVGLKDSVGDKTYFKAKELVNNGSVTVNGLRVNLDIKDLNGEIVVVAKKINDAEVLTTLRGNTFIGDDNGDGTVTIAKSENTSNNMVYIYDTATINATIQNNGILSVGNGGNIDGTLTAGTINNGVAADTEKEIAAVDGSFTVAANSSLIGAEVNNYAESTFTVNGTLDGVTVNNGTITSTTGFTFAGDSAVNGVTVTAAEQTIANTGSLTVTGTLAATGVTIDNTNATVVTTDDSTITINAKMGAEKVEGSITAGTIKGGTIVLDASKFTGTFGSSYTIVDAALTDDIKSLTIVTADAESQTGTKSGTYANGADFEFNGKHYTVMINSGSGIALSEKQGDLTTLLVNNAWANEAPGTPVELATVKGTIGFNAESTIVKFSTVGKTTDPKYQIAKKVILANGDTYTISGRNYYYGNNAEGVLFTASEANSTVTFNGSVANNDAFFLMGGNIAKAFVNKVNYLTKVYQATAQDYTFDSNLTLNMSAQLRVGQPADGSDFTVGTTDLKSPDRELGKANLTIKGTVIAPLAIAEFSTVTVAKSGNLDTTGDTYVYFTPGAALTVNGKDKDGKRTFGDNEYQYKGKILLFNDGGSATFNDTKISLESLYLSSFGKDAIFNKIGEEDYDHKASFTVNTSIVDATGTGDFFGYDTADNYAAAGTLDVTFNGSELNASGKGFTVLDKVTLNLNGTDMSAGSVTNNREINLAAYATDTTAASELTATGTVTNNANAVINVGKAGDTVGSQLSANTITNSGTFNVKNGSTVSTSDTGYWSFDNNKTLLVDGAGSKILGTVSNGHVAAGTATVSNSASIGTADNLSKYVINYAGSTFDVTTGATINASELQNGGVFTIDGANLNVGKLTHRKDQGGSFTVKGASTLKIGNLVEETDMYGPINVADGATLSATSIEGEGTVVFDAATTGTDQGITLSGNNTIAAAIKNNGTITGNGALTAGAITNYGSIEDIATLTAGAITNGVDSASTHKALITAGSIEAASITNYGTVGSQEDGKKLPSLTLSGALTNGTYGNVYVVNKLKAGSIDNAGGIDVGSIETGELVNKTIDEKKPGLITATIIDAASIVNAGNINAGDNGTITTTGTLTNSGKIEDAGTLYVGKTASATEPVTYTYTGTLTNTGAVTADNIYAGLVKNGDSNAESNDAVKIISESISGASISNYGTIEAKSIAIDAGGDGVENAGEIKVSGDKNARGSFNVGTKNATNTNGTIVLDKADLTGAKIVKGTINAINGSVIYNTTDYSSINLTGSTVNAAQVDATSGAKFKVLSSTEASELHISTFIGTIELENGAILKNSDVTRYKVASYAAAVTIADGANVTFTGTNAFTKNANAEDGAKFNFTNSGTLTVNATLPIDAANLTVDGTFVNNGTITIDTSSLEITDEDPVVIKVISFAEYEGSLTSKITVDDTDKYEVLVNQDNISLFYKGSVPVEKSTLVVNHAWSEEPYGKEVMFGVEKGEPVYYRVGINAFDSANELINLTEATKKIKFAKSTSNNYGDLTLTNSTDITVWDSVGLIEGGTVILKNFTVIGSGKDKTRLNIAESAPADTTVQIKAVNADDGNVTITDADVDFDNASTAIEGAVTITGSEVEFDKVTSIGGKLTIDKNSKVEADQGGVFALTTTAVSEIDGELLVSKGTDATLKTVTGTGKIYTDINSKLSFTEDTADAAFITSIDVTGLTKDAGKTFDTNGRALNKFVADGTHASKDIAKYFRLAKEADVTSTITVGDLIQVAGACNEITVTSEGDIADALNHTWTVVDSNNNSTTYYADNVIINCANTTGNTLYLLGNSPDQYVKLTGVNTFVEGVYGGKYKDKTAADTGRGGTNLGGDIKITIDGTNIFNKAVVGGDRIDTTGATKKMNYYRENADESAATISLTINGGTFKNYVAAGMLYQGDYISGSVDVGNTHLTITAGNFTAVDKGIFGGNFASKKAGSVRTTVSGKSSVTIEAGKGDIIMSGSALYVGSYGAGAVGETELTFTGKQAAGQTLKFKQIWGGSSSDKIIRDSKATGNGLYEGSVSGDRTLSFTGFEGSIDCKSIAGFSDVIVSNSVAKLNAGDMSAVENWDFSMGSKLEGAFTNDFVGDTFTFGTATDDVTGFSSWTVFEGMGDLNDTFGGFRTDTSVTTPNVKLFGETAIWNGAAYESDNYMLSLNTQNGNNVVVASKMV